MKPAITFNGKPLNESPAWTDEQTYDADAIFNECTVGRPLVFDSVESLNKAANRNIGECDLDNEYQPPHYALPQGTKDAIDRLADEAVEQMRRTTGYFGDIVSDEQAEDEATD